MANQRDSLQEFWEGNMNLPQIKTKQDSVYEPMSSEISATIFKPHRDSCSQCGTSFMSHFFITCPCTLSLCCSCLSLNDYCITCHQFLGSGSIFTKTPMFSKHIGGHKCYLQKDEYSIKYSPGLKNLLFSHKIHKYKEASSLLTIFLEQKLDIENSNFIFHRIYQILNTIESDQITFFDDLFSELFLNKYRTQVKKNVTFYSNITKVKNFKREKNLSEGINFFLDFGQTNSNRQIKEQRMIKSDDKKVQFYNMFFILSLAIIFLTVITSTIS